MTPTRTQAALKLEEVPPPKWRKMLVRTVIGALAVGLGIAGAALWQWPWQVAVGLCLYGATTWSSQVVVRTLLALVEPVKLLHRAARHGNGG